MTPEQQRLVEAMMAEQAAQQQPPAESRTGRNLAAAGELALGVLPFTRLGRAMLSTVPRAAATGLGAGAVIEGSRGNLSPVGTAEASDQVRQLQQQLKDAGYYKGKIDGNMGPETLIAKERFDAFQQTTRAQEIETQKAAAAAAKAAAEGKGAEAAAAETERKRVEAERKAQERAAGETRLREVEGNTPWWQTAAQQYGPLLGYAAGGAVGHKLQAAMLGRGNAAAQRAADRADRLMAQKPRDVEGRIGRVNQYWSEGAPGRSEPFTFVPGKQPSPYQVNPNAKPASDLYQMSAMSRFGHAPIVPAIGAGESLVTEGLLAHPYREQLAEAERALAADPSEANIQRVQSLRNRLAMAELMVNVGRGTAVTALGTEVAQQYGLTRARPASIGRAETERGRLERILSRPPPAPRKPAKKRKAES
jgi:peptidoglycan hydrolase-like protein with peptidoglycan-binding domain